MNAGRSVKSIKGKIFRLISTLFLPMLVLAVAAILMLALYNIQYSHISSNIIKASSFNQNFKDEVDLKMYYFVSGNSDEIPYREIEQAQALAESLLESTDTPESRRCMESVLDLIHSMYVSIGKILNAQSYDKRLDELENNIYVITELMQEYIYSYLYHEAGELAALQERLNSMLTVQVTLALVIMVFVATLSVKRAFSVSKSITDPVDALSERVEEIGRGELVEKTPVQAEDEKLTMLGTGIEEMVCKLKNQIELNREEQEKLRGIELALLQAQINPHFLYNTLDTIVWLIETGKDQEAEEMVTSLSTYFRSFLSNGKDIISLDEELTHVRSYLEIQQVRYKDRMDYRIESASGLSQCLIPKMTIQPIVENAIYHGIKPKRGKGEIEILATQDEGDMCITVRDTGIGMEASELMQLRERVENGDSSGFGLLSAYKRLRLMYGEDFNMTINSSPGVGTEISIRVPVRTEEKNEEIL